MKNVSSKQYIIKDMPPGINLYLQERARQEKKSINEVIIECLLLSLNSAKYGSQQAAKADPAACPSTDPKLEQETAYLDILDSDPNI